MSTAQIENQDTEVSTRLNAIDRTTSRDRTDSNSFDKTVITEPRLHSWMIIAAGSLVPLGLAGAAVAATYITTYERVATAAWIAVAIVGTAAVVSAAAVSHRRIVSLEHEKEHERAAARDGDVDRARLG